MNAQVPNAQGCEDGLLSSMFADPTVIAYVRHAVSGKDFLDADLGRMYDSILMLHDAEIKIGDILAVQRELKKLSLPEAVTSTAFLGKLISCGVAANARYYADEVREASSLRQVKLLAAELIRETEKPNADPAKIVELHQAKLERLSIAGGESHIRDFRDVAQDVIGELRHPEDHKPGVMTGLWSVDSVVGGFYPGELVVAAGRPGNGKTTFALNVTRNLVLSGHSVLFVSLEMRDRELVRRELASLAGVDSRRLRNRSVTAEQLSKIEAAAAGFRDSQFTLYDPPTSTAENIRSVAKLSAAKHGLDLLVIDYLGIVQPSDPKRPRWEQVGAMTGAFKRMAKELAVPILLLVQLNRDADSDEPPRLSQLRDSGSVEQDADIVMFVHRPNLASNDAALIVGKHRHGAVGQINLQWDGRLTKFIDPQGCKF